MPGCPPSPMALREREIESLTDHNISAIRQERNANSLDLDKKMFGVSGTNEEPK